MGKCIGRIFPQNSVKPNAASHNNASWYTHTDGFLEHSLVGKPVLQGAHLPGENSGFWGGSPLYMAYTKYFINMSCDYIYSDGYMMWLLQKLPQLPVTAIKSR